jgi:predicted outer membrane repeat protein
MDKKAELLLKTSLLLLGVIFICSFGFYTSAAATSSTIYVSTQGNNSWNGLNSTYIGGLNGPKATIKNATGTVTSGGTVSIGSGTYNENSIGISKNMAIIGAGQNSTIINGTQSGTIFYIASGVNVTISNLTGTNGKTTGNAGGIYNYGNLTVTNCKFTVNSAGYGGAIFNEQGGTLTETGNTFQNNTASNKGGAIYHNGVTSSNNSIFKQNSASNGNGGAIYNQGILNVTQTSFQNTLPPTMVGLSSTPAF